MDTKTITGVGVGALLLGGAALMSRSRPSVGQREVVSADGGFLRSRFFDLMRSAGRDSARAKSRADFVRAKMRLALAYENLFLMRAFEGDAPDHSDLFEEWERASAELEKTRNQRGMRPLPI